MVPQVPFEEQRLQSLLDMDVLEGGPDSRLDHVTQLVANVFGAPIASVTLVDEERQVFRSCVGLDISETEREVSFCSHTIEDSAPFVIEDAPKDPRFADNRLVTGPPHIRFYAGVPIHSPDGFAIGALCIIDRRPRTMTAEDLVRLQALGKWVELELQRMALGEPDEVATASRRHQFWALTTDLLCIAGVDGFFKDVSPSFTAALGHSPEALLGRPFLEFVHTQDVAATMAEVERLRDGEETVHFRNRYRHKNGRWVWLEWSAVPRGSVIYAVARDVTDEVAQRKRLERVVDRLQASTSELRDFARIVAHDLRAPLRRIHAESPDLPGPVEDQLAMLEHMIDDLIRYERLFLADLPMHRVDLDEVWEEVVDAAGNELDDATLQVAQPLGVVQGNHDQLLAAFRNLVDNSIKYRHADRPLRIQIQSFEDDDKLVLHYQDAGIGIPTDRREELWKPFQSGAGDGHGMGLPMIRRILERHGGSIRLGASKQGTHFVVELPATPVAVDEEPLGALS